MIGPKISLQQNAVAAEMPQSITAALNEDTRFRAFERSPDREEPRMGVFLRRGVLGMDLVPWNYSG
jgi:hypothetical protein